MNRSVAAVFAIQLVAAGVAPVDAESLARRGCRSTRASLAASSRTARSTQRRSRRILDLDCRRTNSAGSAREPLHRAEAAAAGRAIYGNAARDKSKRVASEFRVEGALSASRSRQVRVRRVPRTGAPDKRSKQRWSTTRAGCACAGARCCATAATTCASRSTWSLRRAPTCPRCR